MSVISPKATSTATKDAMYLFELFRESPCPILIQIGPYAAKTGTKTNTIIKRIAGIKQRHGLNINTTASDPKRGPGDRRVRPKQEKKEEANVKSEMPGIQNQHIDTDYGVTDADYVAGTWNDGVNMSPATASTHTPSTYYASGDWSPMSVYTPTPSRKRNFHEMVKDESEEPEIVSSTRKIKVEK